MLTQGPSGLQHASSLFQGRSLSTHLNSPGSSRPQNTRKTRAVGAARPQNTGKTSAFGASRRHNTHISYNKAYAKKSCFFLHDFRRVPRALCLVRQGEKAHRWTARAPPDHKTLVKHACFWPPEHKTLVKHVLLELPDDIAHISYNKTHAKYVLFVLSPVLIAGFRWVHRAHFLVRQGEKAIASTLQTAKHSWKKKSNNKNTCFCKPPTQNIRKTCVFSFLTTA